MGLKDMSLEELWQLFPIFLVEHNNDWHNWYYDESAIIGHILKDYPQRRISHIGSTYINTIWAKNIVDILVELPKATNLDEVKGLFTNKGYNAMSQSETRLSLNKGYTPQGFAPRVFHIHIRFFGDNDELYFRDYLADNPPVAKEYETLKLKLWKQYPNNRDAYTEAKTEFIKLYTSKAKADYKNKYQ